MIENLENNKILQFINDKFGIVNVKASVVLGSGLGDFANNLKVVNYLRTVEIPGYPQSTVPGHEGLILLCELNQNYFLLFKGRIHLYEGYKFEQVSLPVVIANNFNTKYMILTNAAGGINEKFQPGDLMVIEDILFAHYKNKFLIKDKLITSHIELDSNLIEVLTQTANELNLKLRKGVYGYSLGPSYETPAEITFLKTAGCDAVGMSTIPEIIYANKLNIKVCGISCITNLAAGIAKQKLSHEEVTETANKVKDSFSLLLKTFLSRLE